MSGRPNAAVRNYLEAAALVGAWMAADWVLGLGASAYLILGVPLLAIFQLGVRREPLRKLWVRESGRVHFDWIGAVVAVLLMLAPAYQLVVVALPRRLWIGTLWDVCALAGAICAAFALHSQSLKGLRRGLPSFAAALLIGGALMASGAAARHHSIAVAPVRVPFLLPQFLLYFAVCFVLEEVVFRGALDSHVYLAEGAPAGSGAAWFSAIFISALRGIWHLPVVRVPSAGGVVAAVPALIVVHTLVGVPLSFCWRTGGTLVLPAAAHALVDAYRNVVI